MTTAKTIQQYGDFPTFRAKDIDRLMKTAVGFDSIFNRLFTDHPSGDNYPPYNIKKTGEEDFVIELAVAGFSQPELDIELKEGTIVVSSNCSESPEDEEQFIHRGIAKRSFVRRFVLADDVVIQGANLENGLLAIHLKRVIPEEKKPRKIEIGMSTKQMLDSVAYSNYEDVKNSG